MKAALLRMLNLHKLIKYKELVFLKIQDILSPVQVRFQNHYIDWRDKRIQCIVDYYGKDFFKNKKLLELGCGYGEIGAYLAKLGADVTCLDAREEHLKMLRIMYPFLETVQADLDNEWPFKDKFDVILYLGTLYHLKHFEKPLIRACKSAKHLVLESEVCDSDDPNMIIFTKERGYDQAFNESGNRPSQAYIEKVLRRCGMKYKLLKTSKYDTEDHKYNWKIQNTNKWENGLRRLWFAYNPA